MLLFEPSITVLVKGVALLEEPTTSCRPEAELWKVNTTVRGSELQRFRVGQTSGVGRRQEELEVGRVFVVGSVERPTRDAGQLWIAWVWQSDGQWCRIRFQERAEAGSVPCCWSVAWPENEMRSPTLHVVPVAGVSIVAVAGVLFAEIVTGALIADWFWLSVTRSFALYGPGCPRCRSAARPSNRRRPRRRRDPRRT
jgi:hypothetical protein